MRRSGSTTPEPVVDAETGDGILTQSTPLLVGGAAGSPPPLRPQPPPRPQRRARHHDREASAALPPPILIFGYDDCHHAYTCRHHGAGEDEDDVEKQMPMSSGMYIGGGCRAVCIVLSLIPCAWPLAVYLSTRTGYVADADEADRLLSSWLLWFGVGSGTAVLLKLLAAATATPGARRLHASPAGGAAPMTGGPRWMILLRGALRCSILTADAALLVYFFVGVSRIVRFGGGATSISGVYRGAKTFAVAYVSACAAATAFVCCCLPMAFATSDATWFRRLVERGCGLRHRPPPISPVSATTSLLARGGGTEDECVP